MTGKDVRVFIESNRPEPAIELFPNQHIAVDFLTSKKRAILGDEVGVGKTFPAVKAAMDVSLLPSDQILVITPPHLMHQWRMEIKRFYPSVPVTLLYRHSPDSWTGKPRGFYIVSYNTMQASGRRTIPGLWRKRWTAIICDEAHRLKNPKSQQSKNVLMLGAGHLFLLTGSPFEKGPQDIWGLLHLCDEKKFRAYWGFIEEYFITADTPWKKEIVRLRPSSRPQFEKIVAEYMIRRTQAAMPIVSINVPVDPPKGLKKAHDAALKEWFIEYKGETTYAKNAADLLIKLRRLLSAGEASSAKLTAVKGLLQDIPSDKNVILFTWFRTTAEYVAQELVKDRLVFMVHGGLSPEERITAIEAWRKNPGALLVGTLKSIGEGLNLQCTNTVIFYEHDYIPSTMMQAVARVRRQGQSEDHVVVYHVFHQRTIESKILKVAGDRDATNQDVFDAIFSMDDEEDVPSP